MIDLVKKVSNPTNELVRSAHLHLSRRIRAFTNHHVQAYLQACLEQASEYFRVFNKSNTSISPLIGFYSALNLAKVIAAISSFPKSIDQGTLELRFRTHGASSPTIESIRIHGSGTFAAYAKPNHPDDFDRLPRDLSLGEAYPTLPDLHEIIIEADRSNESLVPVVTIEKYMSNIHTIDANVDLDGIAVDETHIARVRQRYGGILRESPYHQQVLCYPEDGSLRSLADQLVVNSDGRLFLPVDPHVLYTEAEVIYLIFLKFSSLVRYRPKTWATKLHSEESALITKFLDEALIKFWALNVQSYTRDGRLFL